MSRVRAVAAVMAWLVLVTAASTLVWAVISRAGSEVVASQQPLVPATGTAVGQPSGGSTPAPSPASTGSATPKQSPGPSPSSSPGSTPSVPSTAPASPQTSSPSSPAGGSAQRRTWHGLGGVVVAECQRLAIKVISAAPDNGFHAEIKNAGPEELEIEFEGREDEAGRGATVTARCVSGVPAFRAEVEDE